MSSPRNRFSLILSLSTPTEPAGLDGQMRITSASTSSFASFKTSPLPSPARSVATLSIASPRTPLISSSAVNMIASLSQSNEAVPPTTNDLDERERKELLKKARKLSKVFGEVPNLDINASREPSPKSTTDYFSIPSMDAPSNAKQHSTSPSWLQTWQDAPEDSSIMFGYPDSATPSARPSASIRSPSIRSSIISDDQSVQSISIASGMSRPLSPDRQRRATVAKLARHFGENIPPELVIPGSRSASPAPPSIDKRKARRRSSLFDLSSFSLSPAPSFNTTQHSVSDEHSMKRSKSMWGSGNMGFHKSNSSVDSKIAFQQRYINNFGEGNETSASSLKMSEKERALNVKRARKMTQMFGQEPPAELFQIVGTDLHLDDESGGDRNSNATTLSLSSTYLLSRPPRRSSSSYVRRRSDSVSSDVTIEDQSRTPPAASEPEPAQPPTPQTPAPFSSIIEQTPAAFSGALLDQQFELKSETLDAPESAIAFHSRRRRAAKLSRFFGVGYNDISSSFQNSEELLSRKQSLATESGTSTTGRLSVDIKVSDRSRFWAFDKRRGQKLKDADVVDVIDRLRDLK